MRNYCYHFLDLVLNIFICYYKQFETEYLLDKYSIIAFLGLFITYLICMIFNELNFYKLFISFNK